MITVVVGDVYECTDYIATVCSDIDWELITISPGDLVIPVVESNTRYFCVIQSQRNGTFLGYIGPDTARIYLKHYC